MTWSNDFDALSDDWRNRRSYSDLHGHGRLRLEQQHDGYVLIETRRLQPSTPADATVECDGAGNATDLDAWLASNGGATLLMLAAV